MYFTAGSGNETQVVPAIGTTPPLTPHYPFVGPQRPIGGSGLLWWVGDPSPITGRPGASVPKMQKKTVAGGLAW